MPKYNLDEDQTLSGTLEFVIDEKTFEVKKLTNKILEQIDGVDKVTEQFAILCSVEPEETIDLDLRKVGAAIRLIMQSVVESLGGEHFLGKTLKESKRKPKRTTVKNR